MTVPTLPLSSGRAQSPRSLTRRPSKLLKSLSPVPSLHWNCMCCCCTPCGCASVAISPRAAPSRLRQRCWAPNAQDCALALSDGALFLVDGALFLVSARSKLTTLTFGWAWRSSSAQLATRVRRAMGERAGSLTATSASSLRAIRSSPCAATCTGAAPHLHARALSPRLCLPADVPQNAPTACQSCCVHVSCIRFVLHVAQVLSSCCRTAATW